MANIKTLFPAALCATVLMASCGNGGEKTETVTDTTTVTTTAPAKANLQLAAVSQSPEFANAGLGIGNVTAAPQGADSVKVTFNFNVKNYELKKQTDDAAGKLCNNSDKGQHIHFILDNKPYVALYEPKHEMVLPKNGEHNLMVFLSRSYHESVKSKGAAQVYSFELTDGKLEKTPVPATPMVFYSRPKGDYLGKDTENLLFDYYVWNGGLSSTGNKVKAHVTGDGLDTTFTIDEWKAQFLKAMPMGKSSITLTLLDKDGNKVNGPETEVTREFNLSKEEPMTAK
ncbi:MAG: hypothetical protein EOP51_02885 [Sphingobacteriales bacterium]|nr:MAG: hypothetical protein EOP51_02885 [Sphingobacteriales bacterium]